MGIESIETIELPEVGIEESGRAQHENSVQSSTDYQRILWVRIYTEDGIVGLGETYPRPTVDANVIHNHIAPKLIGEDPLDNERIWEKIFLHSNRTGGYAGAEMRALSAIDMALWDIKGKKYNLPIYELLGGKSRNSIPTYNTCYEQELSFMDQPAELAESLLEEGIDKMKIWPYDEIAYENSGEYISQNELEKGAKPIKKIRENFGQKIDVAMEFHGLWNVRTSKKIAKYLERYEPMWLEELLPIGDVSDYQKIAKSTSIPLTVSERLTTKHDYKQLCENVDVGTVMLDLQWCGGFTEAKKIATIAETNHLSVAPHNAAGPILHFANLHYSAAVPNLQVLESIRGRYNGWHRDLVTNDSHIDNGEFDLPGGPGLGVNLNEELIQEENVKLRRTTK